MEGVSIRLQPGTGLLYEGKKKLRNRTHLDEGN